MQYDMQNMARGTNNLDYINEEAFNINAWSLIKVLC